MKRQREPLTARLHEQAAHHGEGDRHDDPELGAEPQFGAHLDPAVRRLHVGAHDIEADPATRDVRNERGGRQPRVEHQVQEVVLTEPRRVDPLAFGLLPHAQGIDTVTVVGDGDYHLRAQLHRVQTDGSAHRFAGLRPHRVGLDAVVDGVTHQVQQ